VASEDSSRFTICIIDSSFPSSFASPLSLFCFRALRFPAYSSVSRFVQDFRLVRFFFRTVCDPRRCSALLHMRLAPVPTLPPCSVHISSHGQEEGLLKIRSLLNPDGLRLKGTDRQSLKQETALGTFSFQCYLAPKQGAATQHYRTKSVPWCGAAAG